MGNDLELLDRLVAGNLAIADLIDAPLQVGANLRVRCEIGERCRRHFRFFTKIRNALGIERQERTQVGLPIPDDPTPYLRIQIEKFGGDPSEYRGRVLDIRQDVQKLRREAGPRLGWDYDRFTDERLSDIEQYNLFPNTMITVQPDDAIVMRAMPHPTDPNRCTWDKFTFHRHPSAAVAERAGVGFEPFDERDVAPAGRPEHDHFTQEDVIAGRKSMTATIDQDIHLIRDVQAGMHSRGFTDAFLNDDESRVQHYHDWYDHYMAQG